MSDQSQNPTPRSQEHHQHMGIILGILVLVLMIILGGIYLWGSLIVKEEMAASLPLRTIPNNEPETPRSEADRAILETLSPSDELSAIKSDLLSTPMESLDADLMTVEMEIQNQ